MPKTKSSSSSLKKPSQVEDKPAVQQAKKVPKQGKLGKEIDDIFGGRKTSSSSLKTPSQVEDKPEVQQAKQVPKQGKLGKEIDDIFGGRKKKKPEAEQPETKETKAEIAKKKRKMKRKERDEGFNDNPKSRPTKRTPEGFRVYTEDELGFNNTDDSGDPRLCPFDCNCCF